MSLLKAFYVGLTLRFIFVRGTTEAMRLPSLTHTWDGDVVRAVLAG
jgi:hypothetical protein